MMHKEVKLQHVLNAMKCLNVACSDECMEHVNLPIKMQVISLGSVVKKMRKDIEENPYGN